jgi:MprA protease rhombosortase-interaction domain-containing protein
MKFLILTALATASLGYGSSLSATAICSQPNPFPSDIHGTGTPGQLVTANLDHCSAGAYADWSVLRISGSANLLQLTDPDYQDANASATWTIGFYLNDPNVPAGYFKQFNIPIDYDVTLAANNQGFPGLGSFTRFGVTVDNDPFTVPVRLSSAVGVGGPDNICPNVLPSSPGCNGHYVGVGSYAVTLYYNTFQTLTVSVSGEALDAAFDAAHSVSLGPIVVDDTTTWSYDDPSIGNPMGFGHAQVSGTPEPSSVLLALAGLVGFGLRKKVASRLF